MQGKWCRSWGARDTGEQLKPQAGPWIHRAAETQVSCLPLTTSCLALKASEEGRGEQRAARWGTCLPKTLLKAVVVKPSPQGTRY